MPVARDAYEQWRRHRYHTVITLNISKIRKHSHVQPVPGHSLHNYITIIIIVESATRVPSMLLHDEGTVTKKKSKQRARGISLFLRR